MGLSLPERRFSAPPRPEKRRVPIEQILAVMGNNPVGQSLPGIGKQLGEALMASAARKRQEAELAALGQEAGADPESFSKLSPGGANLIAQSLMAMRRDQARPRANTVTQGQGVPTQKPPAGFRWTSEGDLEAIPGGPAKIKIEKIEAKEDLLRKGAVSQADRIISKVDQALARVGPLSAGFGAMTSGVPGSPAKNLASDLTTIKANLGFAELQAMRQASPTGGALGQVAIQELEALQATLASLDQAQSPGQLSSRLNEIKTHYQNWKNAVNQSGTQEASPSGPMTPDQEAAAYLQGL